MRQYEDLLIDVLLDDGFTVAEAQRLIALQDRIERERLEADLRRWLGDRRADRHMLQWRDAFN